MQPGLKHHNDQLETVPFRIKPSSLKELCDMYGTTYKTFHRWIRPHIKEIGARNGRYYSILQVRIIMERLGAP